jgi:hypothetical protein
MMPSVKRVSPCGVRMMGRFFVMSAFMMLSCFTMVTRGMHMVFLGLLMVLGCLLGHGVSSIILGQPRKQRNAYFMTVI